MMKVNIGLFGIFLVIILNLYLFFDLKSRNQEINEQLFIIKSILEDIDDDIHEIEKKNWKIKDYLLIVLKIFSQIRYVLSSYLFYGFWHLIY